MKKMLKAELSWPAESRGGPKRAATLALGVSLLFMGPLAMAHPVPLPLEEANVLAGLLPADLAVFSPLKHLDTQAGTRVTHHMQSHNLKGSLLFPGQSRPTEDALLLERSAGVLPQTHRRPLPVAPQDVLVVDESAFAPCDGACEAQVRARLLNTCGSREFLRAELEGKTPPHFVYVSHCPKSPQRVGESPPHVRLSLKQHTLWSDLLSYRYSAANHMLLEEFALSSVGGDVSAKAKALSKDVPLLSGSEMHLYGKPRYFFPLHFTGNDVRSELQAYLQDPLATSGQLSFFLDVFFFKVKLDLRSSVTLFKDAVHVPVVMTLPISGSSLREGSGLFYGFKAASAEVLANMRSSMPRLGGSSVEEQNGVPTFFTTHKGTCVAVAVREPPEFESLGFHPRLAFASDLAAFGFPRTQADFGVFYDIRKLRKGRYRFDVWFYVARGRECEGLEAKAARGFPVKLKSFR